MIRGAWPNTLAFPESHPDPEKVRAHVHWCWSEGLLKGRVPVLWDFGEIHWEKADWSDYAVRPYGLDLADWEMARATAYAALAGPKMGKGVT